MHGGAKFNDLRVCHLFSIKLAFDASIDSESLHVPVTVPCHQRLIII